VSRHISTETGTEEVMSLGKGGGATIHHVDTRNAQHAPELRIHVREQAPEQRDISLRRRQNSGTSPERARREQHQHTPWVHASMFAMFPPLSFAGIRRRRQRSVIRVLVQLKYRFRAWR
jgi:hypothetical protein